MKMPAIIAFEVEKAPGIVGVNREQHPRRTQTMGTPSSRQTGGHNYV